MCRQPTGHTNAWPPDDATTRATDKLTMSVNLQQQIRDNSRELNDFLRDLNDWTGEVKEKDRALRSGGEIDLSRILPHSSSNAPPPPVRGRVEAHHVKSEEDLAVDKKKKKRAPPSPSQKVIDPEDENQNLPTSKDQGNSCFKNGDYTTAIAHYTRAIKHEGGACAAYANRAMCSIKLGRWTEAEADCNEALMLEPTYLKVCGEVLFK